MAGWRAVAVLRPPPVVLPRERAVDERTVEVPVCARVKRRTHIYSTATFCHRQTFRISALEDVPVTHSVSTS
eukprot:1161480-Pelagomonas_calceolata.AAC.21